MPTDKRSTTFRLTDEARGLLEQLAEMHGISQTAVLEMLIRDRGRRDLPTTPAEPSPQEKPAGKGRGRKGKGE